MHNHTNIVHGVFEAILISACTAAAMAISAAGIAGTKIKYHPSDDANDAVIAQITGVICSSKANNEGFCNIYGITDAQKEATPQNDSLLDYTIAIISGAIAKGR